MMNNKKSVFCWSVLGVVFLVLAFAFPLNVSADVLTTVTLTPEQTLALYGTEIPAVYRDGDTWKSCTFEFFSVGNFDAEDPMPVDDFDLRASSFSGYSSAADYINNNYRVRPRLYYICKQSDAPIASSSDFEFSINPVVDISGVAYYRQSFSFTFWRDSYRHNSTSNVYCASTVSYSSSPVISNVQGWDGYENGYIITSYIGNNSTSQYHTYFNLIDVYLQNVVDGQEQTFSVSDQVLKFGRSTPVVIPPSYDPSELYFILSIQCPTVTDGYVLPEPPTPEPNIPGQLTDIQTSIDASNTQLALILAKLDQIYNVSIAPTINISSDSQSSLISGIVDGIRGLFVPSQADVLAWRVNMQSMLDSNLSPFLAVEGLRDTAVSRVLSAAPVGYIDMPLIDLTGSGVDFKLTASDFPDYSPVDNGSKVRVSLKVADSSWSFFYELLAWGIDVFITLAFINMIINKLHGFFVGDKVVEIDDN